MARAPIARAPIASAPTLNAAKAVAILARAIWELALRKILFFTKRASLKRWRLKRIAVGWRAALQAFFEPAGSLLCGSMGERLGDDIAARFHLQPVIANHAGGAQRFIDVAIFQKLPRLGLLQTLRIVRPYSRIAVGLEFHANGYLIGAGFVASLHQPVCLLGRTKEILNVMSHFVGDDVRLRKIARGAEAITEFLKETGVEIDLL